MLKQMMEAKSPKDFIRGYGYKFSQMELFKLIQAVNKMVLYAKLDPT